MRIIKTLVAAAAVALAAACADPGAGPDLGAGPGPGPSPDAGAGAGSGNAPAGSVRRLTQLAGSGMDTDYTALASPQDAVAKADLVVQGTLVEVTDGIRFTSTDSAQQARRAGGYTTFVIAVDEVLDGDPAKVTGGRVYVEVSTSTRATPQQLDGLNPRAKVVAVLDDITDWRPNSDTTVVRPATVPAAAPLYASYTDGLWLQGTGDRQMFAISAETDDLAPAWGGASDVDQLAAGLRAGTAAN